MTDLDPLLEDLKALRQRLAYLESLATQPEGGEPVSQPKTLEAAVSAHYSVGDTDKARARLESVAHGFVSDAGMEQALAARAKDPIAYDAEMRRVGADDGLRRALYEKGRAAAIELGQWTPPTPEQGEAS